MPPMSPPPTAANTASTAAWAASSELGVRCRRPECLGRLGDTGHMILEVESGDAEDAATIPSSSAVGRAGGGLLLSALYF